MNKDNIDFGDYVEIEQKRFGVPNELYRYKVIRSLRSNSYVEVPVHWSNKEILHDEVVPVLACICCGVIEVDVRNFRLEDVNVLRSRHQSTESNSSNFVLTVILKRSNSAGF